MGLMTRTHWICRMEHSPAEMAVMGAFGRYLEMDTAVCPIPVRTMIRGPLEPMVTFTAAEHTDSTADVVVKFSSVFMRMPKRSDS